MKIRRIRIKLGDRPRANSVRRAIARIQRLRGHPRAVLIVTAAFLGLVAACAGILAVTWPDVRALRAERPTTTAFMERFRGATRESGRAREPEWEWVRLEKISPWLRKAVVTGEDTEFFSHRGFSSHETKAAIKEAIARRRAPRGASTITQQLARNLWLSPDRSLMRKLREALLTVQLERHLTKQRILELYLNVVEFGPGVYGAEAAARHYFGIAASDLGETQAAMLAAGLPRPRSWHPGSTSRAYLGRVERIRSLMHELSYLDRYVGLEARPAGPVSIAPPVIAADTSGASDGQGGEAGPPLGDRAGRSPER